MCIYNVLLYLSGFKINGVWVMSDIDWSKAPEGTTHYSPETGEDNPCWVKMLDSGFLYKAENHFNKHKDTPWMKGSFNFVDLTIKPKPESKPVYTQAMADKGELPLVGMECLFFKDSKLAKADWFKGVFAGKSFSPVGNAVFLFVDNNTRSTHFVESTCHFKPITPPIELIGGNPYMFNYGEDKETFLGFFNKNDFNVAGVLYNSKLATNIQLLEVKL